MEKLRQLRVGVLEAPAGHGAILARSERLDDRVRKQVVERDHVERVLGSGLQHHRRRGAGLEGVRPAARAQAPAVARLQAGEAERRLRRGQIVAGVYGLNSRNSAVITAQTV